MHEEEAFIHMKLDEEHFTVGVDNRINFLIPREAFLKLYSEDKEKLLGLIDKAQDEWRLRGEPKRNPFLGRLNQPPV